jgi:hypothetical protein
MRKAFKVSFLKKKGRLKKTPTAGEIAHGIMFSTVISRDFNCYRCDIDNII